LEKGLESTFQWYLDNYNFFTSVSKKLYDKRLGLK
jgi:dTDP-D-glucose 4,6-dehydratase